MPTYYFDIRDAHGLHRDDVGLELRGMDEAIAEGRRALADISREALADGDDQNLEITIRDHSEGPVRLVLTFETKPVDSDGYDDGA